MVNHEIEAHFEVKATATTPAPDRDHLIQERAIVILTEILAESTPEAEKFARAIVLGVIALPKVLQQAIAEIDGATI